MSKSTKQQKELRYQSTSFSRWFAPHGRYDAVVLAEDGVQLVGVDGHLQTLAFLKMGDDFQVAKNWFWSVISVKCIDGTVWKIGGIKNDFAPIFLTQIKRACERFQRQYIEPLQSELLQAHYDLAALSSKKDYLRRSVFNGWLVRYEYLKEKITQPVCSKLDEKYTHYLKALYPALMESTEYYQQLNRQFVDNTLEDYKCFFDSVESQPLTKKQREACVINEQSNLVLAGAGTGKTSVMVGRAGYLLQSNQAVPSEVLMLAYGSDAKDEMAGRIKKRLGVDDLTVKTFHSLGMEIIAKVEGAVPILNKMVEDDALKARFIDDQFKTLMQTSGAYQSKLIDYFLNHAYPYKSLFNFKSYAEYVQFIQEHEVRTLKGELAKSLEECEIANYLAQQGVVYEYEAQYKVDTTGPDYKAYQPDFYLPEYDIYIEHFAVDEHNKTPAFIDNAKYVKGMVWKRALHEKNETTLIETYSYQKAKGELLISLEQSLLDAGVAFKPVPKSKLLALLNKDNVISTFSKLLGQLLALLKSALLSIQDLYDKAKQSSASAHMMAALKLFEPIYEAYEAELKRTNTIDFDDMIARAIAYIKGGQFQSPYKHILVDEFQDISAGRAQLVKSLIQQQASTLFCVGDDWQSIYRFSGSDISITNHFPSHFGDSATSVLDKTFRFNNKIGEVAAKFVTQNPAQTKKEIESLNHVDSAAVSLIKAQDKDKGVLAALGLIADQVSHKVTVMILVRFKHDRPDIKALNAQYKLLDIIAMTAHAAKGKEADYVVVVGLTQGKVGFPSEKTTHPLLKMLLPDGEQFRYAEERRLFYVALTRAKHHVYLVVDANKPSAFVRELIKDKYAIVNDSTKGLGLKDTLAPACPECKAGSIVSKEGRFGAFHGCSNHPVCKYTQSSCEWCSGALVTEGRFRVCEKDACGFFKPICPVCNGLMEQRNGRNGKFWGCRRYSNKTFPCKHTENYIDYSMVNKRQ